MKTKTLMIGLIVTAVALAPLAMAAPGDGSRGDGRHFGPRQEGGPGGGWQRGGEGGNWGPRHEGGPRGQRPRGGKGPGGSFAKCCWDGSVNG